MFGKPKSNAWYDGREAYRAGLGLNTNPYNINYHHEVAQSWTDGWISMEKEVWNKNFGFLPTIPTEYHTKGVNRLIW